MQLTQAITGPSMTPKHSLNLALAIEKIRLSPRKGKQDSASTTSTLNIVSYTWCNKIIYARVLARFWWLALCDAFLVGSVKPSVVGKCLEWSILIAEGASIAAVPWRKIDRNSAISRWQRMTALHITTELKQQQVLIPRNKMLSTRTWANVTHCFSWTWIEA